MGFVGAVPGHTPRSAVTPRGTAYACDERTTVIDTNRASETIEAKNRLAIQLTEFPMELTESRQVGCKTLLARAHLAN
jgi:hypothetical protein